MQKNSSHCANHKGLGQIASFGEQANLHEPSQPHSLHSGDLERLFADCFGSTYHTCLRGGADEPLYQPANINESEMHTIYYRYDYFASALHEIAHWCIAGVRRRTLEDYGYWYAEDGRDLKQQAEFESVEIRPQAIEWAFSLACRKPFRVSIDNLEGAASNERVFSENVKAQLMNYQATGFPKRAAIFLQALHNFYHTQPNTWNKTDDE